MLWRNKMSSHPDETQQDNRNWIERLFRHVPHNQAELLHILRHALQENIIDDDAYSMMEGVMSIANQQVRDIMVPRSQVIAVEQNQTPQQFLPIVLEASHSRFPVLGEGKDDVIGILLAKDLLKYYIKHKDKPFDVTRIMRPALFVPESKRLDTLLKDFRQSHNHLAIVVDEYGGVSGIVTIEDVLEEIVGEIEDEFDIIEKPTITVIEGNRYHVNALTEIDSFNHYFHSNFSDELVDTIGGLVTQQIGHLPGQGDTIDIDRFQFTVTEADERHIICLEVTAPITVRSQ